MSESFTATVDRRDGFAVVYTQGYIDNQGGEELAGTCYQLIEADYRVLLVDMAGTQIINSIGLSILIEIIEKLTAVGGRLAFCSLTPTIAKTFDIVGIAQYAQLFGDEATAIARLQPV